MAFIARIPICVSALCIFRGKKPLRFAWRWCVGIANMDHQINEDIRDKEVRLISESGEQLGVVSVASAMAIAEENGLDLVKIAPGSNPPVCKLHGLWEIPL